jgi:DNA polymerase IV
MHVDLNSCFATVEQQFNPYLRNKPIGVGAYEGPGGCIIAPSIEAKVLGVKTGMRVKDGLSIAPNLVIVPSDPDKYRYIHQQLKRILLEYTDRVDPKSIDEFVLDLEGCPSFKKGMFEVGREIKRRVREEVGDWLRINVGIAPNRFLAKTAAGLHKPDGLDEINKDNYLHIYSQLKITDLCGIDKAYSARLCMAGINTVMDFYNASPQQLKREFRSVVGYDWYLRLRGWEIDDIVFKRKSYGNSYALPINLSTPEELKPILMKLVDKTARRLRKGGFKARGVHVSIAFRSGNFWHRGYKTNDLLFHSPDIFKMMYQILCHCPYREQVRVLAETCFDLEKQDHLQMGLFADTLKKDHLTKAIDMVNDKFGSQTITPAAMMNTQDYVPDRVAFGGVKELLEYITDIDIDDINTFDDDVYLEEMEPKYVW